MNEIVFENGSSIEFAATEVDLPRARSGIVPDLTLEVLRHVDLGERVICAYCKVNGLPAKRLTQTIFGRPVNETPVWNLDGRIVGDRFAELLEAEYQSATAGQTVVIHQDLV